VRGISLISIPWAFLSVIRGWLRRRPSPDLQIVDALNNVVATTPTGLMTTPADSFYDINGRASANLFEMFFTPSSTVSLTPRTYNFRVWDTGEQRI
jgi:hypothetical protein